MCEATVYEYKPLSMGQSNFSCPYCGTVQDHLPIRETRICTGCNCKLYRKNMQLLEVTPNTKTLTIWLKDGREIVCYPAGQMPEERTGMYCYVAPFTAQSCNKKVAHVYFEDREMLGHSTVFLKGCWWTSPVAIHQPFTTDSPKKQLLKKRLEQLEFELIEVREEYKNVK